MIGGRLMSGRSAIRTLPLAVSSSKLDCARHTIDTSALDAVMVDVWSFLP